MTGLLSADQTTTTAKSKDPYNFLPRLESRWKTSWIVISYGGHKYNVTGYIITVCSYHSLNSKTYCHEWNIPFPADRFYADHLCFFEQKNRQCSRGNLIKKNGGISCRGNYQRDLFGYYKKSRGGLQQAVVGYRYSRHGSGNSKPAKRAYCHLSSTLQ